MADDCLPEAPKLLTIIVENAPILQPKKTT